MRLPRSTLRYKAIAADSSRRPDFYLSHSFPRLKCWRDDIHGFVLSAHRTMPDATTEGRHVNLVSVLRIGNYAVAPFEIEAWNSLPMLSSVGGPPHRGFESGGVQNLRVLRIDSHVVYVLVAIQNRMPALAAIFREVNPSALAMLRDCACPRGKIKPLRSLGIDRETIGCVYSGRKWNPLPMFGPVA